MYVRGRDEYGLSRVIFFDIMSHLPETSAGFGGQVVRRNLLHRKAEEHLSLLRRMGDEISRGETFGRVCRIPI